MIKLSKEANRNYTAKVVQLKGLKPHSNADRLQVCTIDFQQVITGLDAKDGDLYVYFPVECAINADFLSTINAFREKELNKDNTKVGFFEKNCRVKAMRLRNEVSNGYIVPLSQVLNWANEGQNIVYCPEDLIGKEFDIINGKEICKKYFPKVKQSQSKDKQGRKPKETKLIDGQFRFHVDTDNLRRNADKIFPEDLISVTYKYHGTNAVFGNILTKKKLSWKDKLAKKLGVNVIDTEYDFVYSSRRVVKNPEIKEDANHFYGTDVWGEACKKFELEKIIPKGITIYFEIVGYTSDRGYIQQKFDYGYKQGQFGIVIFRATFINTDGEVFEFSRPQLEEFCNKYELPISKSFFYGKAKDMYPELDSEISIEQWQSKFIEKLEKDYNEKDCFVCKNKVPEEGVVVRKEKLYSCESYKLKSFRFLEYEGKLADKQKINIEDEN